MSDEFVEDPVFGRLRWDDKYTIVGEYEYAPGVRVDVVINADFEEADLEEVMSTARKALAGFRKNESKLRLQTAKQLQAHRRDASTPLSDVDLANGLALDTLDFDEEGPLNVTWKRSKLLRPGRIYTIVSTSGKFERAGVGRSDEDED
jgi:hypothetical protein